MILPCSEVGKSVDEQVQAQAQDLLEKVPSEALLKWSGWLDLKKMWDTVPRLKKSDSVRY